MGELKMEQELKDLEEAISSLNKVQRSLYAVGGEPELFLEAYNLNKKLKQFYITKYKNEYIPEDITLEFEKARLDFI